MMGGARVGGKLFASWRIIFRFRDGDAYEVRVTDETH
jgi:hypothetical protein